MNPLPNQKPQLVILRQNCLSVETVSKNGVQKQVHVVVKNQPFLIQVSCPSSVVDLQAASTTALVEARLVYDCDSMKEVDFVKLKPLDYKCHTNEFDRQQITVELRIKVLSSQLEDMLFRVLLTPIHPVTSQRIYSSTAISEPIKVVSKPDVVKKKKTSVAGRSRHHTCNSVPKRRGVDSTLMESLTRIETNCTNQHELLEQLDSELRSVDKNTMSLKQENSKLICPDSERDFKMSFESAFRDLLRAYDKIDQDHRPEKIRRLIQQISGCKMDGVCELFEIIGQDCKFEKNCHETSPSEGSNGFCMCESCPFKTELEQIDDFYSVLLNPS